MWLKDLLAKKFELIFKKRTYLLLDKELTADTRPAPARRLDSVAIRPEHRQQLEQFIREHHVDSARSLRMVNNCLQHRYGGYLALLDGQIIGYRWWADRAMGHPQLTLYGLTLRDNEVYSFSLYVARAFRNRGYAKEFLAITDEQLRERGYTRVCNSVDTDNMPARRAHETRGVKQFGLCTYFCFFSLVVYSAGRWLPYNPVWM